MAGDSAGKRPTLLEQWRAREGQGSGAGQQVALSREQIVRTTLELIRRDGVRNLSIRKLAAELGAGAASIYWHVQNKDELLGLAFDEVLLSVELPKASGDWRADCMAAARAVRAALLVYGELFELAAAQPTVGPGSLRFTDDLIGIMRAGGFPDDLVVRAYSVMLDTLIGTVMLERSFVHVYESGDVDFAALHEEYLEFFDALPADRFPHLVAMRRQLVDYSGKESADARFETSVNVLLDGLERLRDRS